MAYRLYDQNQRFLLPPSLNEWIEENHPVKVFSEILDRIEINGFRECKTEGRPSFHPLMMTKVLLWGYATGVRSSRKIEGRLKTDTAFMWLSGLEKPDFRTLCLFRTNNRSLIEETFTKVIITARSMGMGRLGTVSLDGTKVQASAGIDSFRKLDDWRKELAETKEEVRKILREAETVDKEEDGVYGKEKRGDEIPEGLENKQKRIEKIEKVLKEVEVKAKEGKSRVSSTDPDAVFMHRKGWSIPAYNAQAAVTEDQMIVYAEITTEPIDVNQLQPAIEGIEETLREKPDKMLADAGYSGGKNLEAFETKTIDGYIPASGERNIGKIEGARPELFRKEEFVHDVVRNICVCPAGQEMYPKARSKVATKYSGRELTVYRTSKGICKSCHLKEQCTTDEKHGRAISIDGYEVYRQRMRDKLNTEAGKEIYGKRKTMVEPVFGQIRMVGGFDRFLLRGKEKARLEWKLTATAHNLLKMTRRIAEGAVRMPAEA